MSDSPTDEFTGPISDAAKGLYFISETDAEIIPYRGEKAEAVTMDEIRRQTSAAMDAPVEEVSPETFFARLTQMQDWFDDAHRERAARFAALYGELKRGLTDLHVFRIGRVQIDIYIIGLDVEGRLTGVQTKAVET